MVVVKFGQLLHQGQCFVEWECLWFNACLGLSLRANVLLN